MSYKRHVFNKYVTCGIVKSHTGHIQDVSTITEDCYIYILGINFKWMNTNGTNLRCLLVQLKL